MRLLELTGPSGSGKSAIYAEMVKMGGFVPNPSPTIQQSVEMINKHLPDWPSAQDFAYLLKYIFRDVDGEDVRAAKRLCGTYRQFAKAVWAAFTPHDGWLVVDGGLIHRGQGIARMEASVPVERYFESLPLPDLVVAVTADMETVKRRGAERGHDDRSDETEMSFDIHNTAMATLRSRGARILKIDTTDNSPADNAHFILQKMGTLHDD